MTKIFDFNAFMEQRKNPARLNESRSEYYNEIVDFEKAVHMVCEDYRYDIENEKKKVAYLGDDVDRLVAEIRNLPTDAFLRLYDESYYDDNIVLYENNGDDFVDEINKLCKDKNIEGASLLYNIGSWNQADKYAAFVYPKYNNSWTWVCSFNDDNFPTKMDDFMDYFVYIVIDMDGWDSYIAKFGFSYNLDFEANKRKIMSEYKYPESMIDLVYGMYVKYYEHNGWEPEIK